MPDVNKIKVENTDVSNFSNNQKSSTDPLTKSFIQVKRILNDVTTEFLDLDANDMLDQNHVSKQYITSVIESSGKSPEQFLKEAQAQLEKELKTAENTRDRTVIAAKFLSTKFPKLPYFWGGGHDQTVQELKGIDLSWGQKKKVTKANSTNYKVGKEYFNSLDCSGFVSWCLVNGGYPLKYVKRASEFDIFDQKRSLTDKDILNDVKPGDLAWMDKHIGIIIDVNQETKELTIAHVSGSGGGMNITTQSTVTGKITKDDVGVNYDINIRDKNNNPTLLENRVGSDYFTHIIPVSYSD